MPSREQRSWERNMQRNAGLAALGALLFSAAGCADNAQVPLSATPGSDPTPPAPQHSTIPTIHIAPAVGWQADATPQAAADLHVQAFATGLTHPRWLYVLPNGDVLVAETNAP